MDLTQLITSRDRLNADIARLQAASNVDQAKVDAIRDTVDQADAAVNAALTPDTPPSNGIDFTSYDMSVNKLVENFKTIRGGTPTLQQATVDALQVQMESLNTAFLRALGLV